MSNKKLIPKMLYSYNSRTKKSKNQIKWAKKLKDTPPKIVYENPVTTWKDPPHHCSLGKQIKMRYLVTHSRLAIFKNQKIGNVFKDVKKLKPLYIS